VAYGYGRPSGPVVVVALCAGFGTVAIGRSPIATAAGVVCLAFSLGALDAQVRVSRADAGQRLAASVPRCGFYVVALESEGGLGTLAAARALSCGRAGESYGALLWIEDPAPPAATLAGEGWIVPLGDDAFDRARRRYGAGAELVVDHARVVPPRDGIAGLAHDLRSGLARSTDHMRRDRAALVRGLTTGDTSLLAPATADAFRSAGLSHLVAVSGQNVAMVVGAVAAAAHPLGARVRLVVALLALGLFVVVVGPQPSVLRAAAMAAIALTGLGLGVRAEPWHLLALALVVVIALRPAVLYSAGLHLSAAATAGLLLWARPLAARLTRLPRWVALSLAATLAAQLAVIPLLAGVFSRLSIVAPVANVLAVPAVPPATVLGLCAAVAGAVDPRAGRPLALLAEPFVAWILWVADVFGRATWSAVEIPAWTAWPLGSIVLGAALTTAARRRAATLGSER
jgi:ComEC/Rec2-related protein